MSEFSFSQKDALLQKITACPTAAATPVFTDAIDLGELSRRGVRIDPMELLLASPQMTATNLPASTSLTYSLEFSNDKTFQTSETTTITLSDWKQTGSANGCDAVLKRFRPWTDAPQYVRAKCTLAGTASLSDVKFVFEAVI
ncbi:MAG: hypothetical protein FWD31_02100 [Planctomycetaceae bacterium]|nr:hypothetical protein [Planctomycetaceae bacterium]